jgi:hypothetical protein
MTGRLPPGWTVEDFKGRPLYKSSQSIQWARPRAPPGWTKGWPLILHAAHILIKHKESRNPRSHNKTKRDPRIVATRDEAHKIITDLRAQIMAGKL